MWQRKSRCVSENPWYATVYSSEAKLNSSAEGSAVILCPNGEDSAIAALLTLCASETVTPSLIRAAACLRFSGVIRFNVPSSSAAPQRPQLESDFIIPSQSDLETLGFTAGSALSAANGADGTQTSEAATLNSRQILSSMNSTPGASA